MSKQAAVNKIREHRLFLIDTLQDLERRFIETIAIYESRQLPLQERHEVLSILNNLKVFKNKAMEQLKTLDEMEKDLE